MENILRFIRTRYVCLLPLQVSKERFGKVVDSRCHQLTASYVRQRHHHDETVPICQFFEVRFKQVHFTIVRFPSTREYFLRAHAYVALFRRMACM